MCFPFTYTRIGGEVSKKIHRVERGGVSSSQRADVEFEPEGGGAGIGQLTAVGLLRHGE